MKSHFTSRDLDAEDQKLVDQYLKNGGSVTECPAGERTEELEYTSGFYQKHRRKKDKSND